MSLFFEEQKKLRFVNFTNLGLEDEQFKVIAQNAISLKGLILNANDNTQSGLRNLVDMALDSSSSSMIIRLEVMNHVKLDAGTFEVLHRHLQHHSCRLQAFQCTYSIVTEKVYRQTIAMYLQLHCLNLEQRYYHPLATPTDCIQVLSEVNGNLECLYTLLRENPCLCNRAMNGAFCRPNQSKPPILPSFWQWFGRLCVALYFFWIHRTTLVPLLLPTTDPDQLFSSVFHSSSDSSSDSSSAFDVYNLPDTVPFCYEEFAVNTIIPAEEKSAVTIFQVNGT
jgi:hypothetical protein